METRPVVVELKQVQRVFAGSTTESTLVLDGLDLSIHQGAFLALIGPSGCGKSTILRLISKLDQPDAGSVHVSPLAKVAYVFQDAQLLPWRTVSENVALPLELAGMPQEERQARVAQALKDVELVDAANRRPGELSGGMRMRASIARALSTHPTLLLMDEPFAALDEITRNRLDERLRALHQEKSLTVIFVTHAIFEATFLADRAVVFSKRPAKIVHDCVVELPKTRDAALRGSPQFAHVAADLFAALERGAT